MVVATHSGVLPFDGMMIATDVFRHADPPRLVRYMVDYFVYQVPFLGPDGFHLFGHALYLDHWIVVLLQLAAFGAKVVFFC